MDRYDSWSDHYCYPGTNVLINRYGIKDIDLLEEAERSVTTITAQNLTLSQPPFFSHYPLQDTPHIIF